MASITKNLIYLREVASEGLYDPVKKFILKSVPGMFCGRDAEAVLSVADIAIRSGHLIQDTINDRAIPKEHKVHIRVNEIAKKLGLEKEVRAIIADDSSAQGITFTNSIPFIYLDKALLTVAASKDELDFVIAHELSHIEHNDSIRGPVTAFLGAAAASGILYMTGGVSSYGAFDSILSSLIMRGTALITESIATRFFEREADLNFLSKTTFTKKEKVKILEGGVSLFKKFREKNLALRKEVDERSARNTLLAHTMLSKLVVSQDGDNRLDFSHPGLSSRIACLEKFQREIG